MEDFTTRLALQVRRKADPAKGMVKEWVQNWRDVRVVSGDASFKQIKGKTCTYQPVPDRWHYLRWHLLIPWQPLKICVVYVA